MEQSRGGSDQSPAEGIGGRGPPFSGQRDVPGQQADATDGNGWPTGWPRLQRHSPQSQGTQAVLFIGGDADGLHDEVQEEISGQLPAEVQSAGSIYGLTETAAGQLPEYHLLRAASGSESASQNPDADGRTAVGRERAAEARDQAGRRRDVAAYSRDQAGAQRDVDADERDRRAEEDWHPATGSVPLDDILAGSAAADRNESRMDRGVAASDRLLAEHDRSIASADRSAAARDRRHASIDGLTGVYSRDAGLVELERDVARVARTGHRLVLAFVDVDHLKVVNDVQGHAAGDRLLQTVAATLQAALRSYDVVIRYGGDEFLCVIQGIDLTLAGPRFARVNVLLAHARDQCSVTVGLAALQAGESATSLIERADADLYRQRQQREDGPAIP